MSVTEIRRFGEFKASSENPQLASVQFDSYSRFLQDHIPADKRIPVGLEGLLREIFPIVSYDNATRMEYVSYELGKPRYSPDECRQLRLTYGLPFRVRLRLVRKDREDIMEDSVYLGELPIMIGGGEFIINGAERAIVSQLHRSPGVDFIIDSQEGDRPLHACRIIPERGSWIEINVTKKEIMIVRIDQSSKISVTTFLRAMDERFSTTEAIIREFYPTSRVAVDKLKPDMWAVGPIIDKETGEEIVKAGCLIGENLQRIQQSTIANSVSSDDLDKVGFIRKLSKFSKERGEADRKKSFLGDDVYKGVPHYKWLRRCYIEGVPGLEDEFPQLEFKWIRTDEEGPLTEKELETLEKSLIRFHDPSFNKKGKGDGSADKETHFIDEKTRSLFERCKKINSEPDWLSYSSIKDYEKAVNEHPDLGDKKEKQGPQGIYFFRPCGGKVKDGYVGLAGLKKADNPNAQGLRQRLHFHFDGDYLTAGGKDGTDKSLLDRFIDDSLKLDWVKIEKQCDKIEKKKSKGSRKTQSVVEVCSKISDPVILNSLADDASEDHESALLRIYARLRPGNPSHVDKAKILFKEKFFDENRYRLGRVGRFRLNRKFDQSISEDEMTLRPDDFLNSLKYVLKLRNGEGSVDDIDHLGNRRLRTIDELATDEMRKGFLKLRRSVQERMSIKDLDQLSRIAELINSKSVASAVDFFFGRGELSQVVDQTNPLSQLTHERRLSALGPGGLNRKRAGFEVRDVHISHYGRICPIETPEGTNIGLISSLSIYANVDEYGFLVTPYRKVENGKIAKAIPLRADQEMEAVLAPMDVLQKDGKTLKKGPVLARVNGDLAQVDSSEVQYIDYSSKQTVGVSASLIPFLEHDDANRALMGSNMQRQAVPLLRTEGPLVATGMEKVVAQHSSMVERARKSGAITYVDASKIVIDEADEYELRKFVGLNERTCLNQKPIVKLGQKVKKDQIIADGASTSQGELALGRNVLVGFMMFDGYNFEDAILISEKLVKDDSFTSIHIDTFEVEIRETKLGREEFTRDIPNVSEKALGNLDEGGIIRTGTYVRPDDILVGKVSPKSKSELSPEEKLLYAIFGRAGEDVKNDSLVVPKGTEGIVIDAKRFSRRMYMNDEQKKEHKKAMEKYKSQMKKKICEIFRQMARNLQEKLNLVPVDPGTKQKLGVSDNDDIIWEQVESFELEWIKAASKREKAEVILEPYQNRIAELQEEMQRRLQQMKRGDELPSGVLEMVKVYIATKRRLSVGDKMAGRHGNKGVIARILPEEDMPFLPDGTPLEILLNPLGVPGRMNVGQILEAHLGWAANILGFQAVNPVFDGASEEQVHAAVDEANQKTKTINDEIKDNKRTPNPNDMMVEMPFSGKLTLCDGRTGEPLEQQVTVGYMYLMKLHHLVDDKIHARATGPYSLITQQPLGGKARTGGQRFGEMEVWGLEAYGTAYILQELLTVKSDDVEGRTKIYESMVKGNNVLEAGTPVSFDVLCNEIRGLGLNIQLEKKRID